MRLATNGFIAAFLLITLLDTLPLPFSQVETGRRLVDSVIDVLGIWQGPWNLFAPQVDKENHRIEVTYSLSGKTEKVVRKSPDWVPMNCFERFRHSRFIEFYDRVRISHNAPTWESYADYLKRQFELEFPEEVVAEIELASLVERIPAPTAGMEKAPEERIRFYGKVFE